MFILNIAVGKSTPTATTYMGSIPKKPDIKGNPNQVFKFDNF